MDSTNASDVTALQQLLNMGGNGAAMVGVYIAWQIYKDFRATMERFARSNEALRRAVAVLHPESARIIEDHERAEETLTAGKGGA